VSAPRHPDLLTRPEAAALLGVSAARLARGFGPRPLPAYNRPVYYSRAQCEQWLEAQRQEASTGAPARPVAPPVAVPAPSSSARIERQVAAELRLRQARTGGGGRP
jgi:hypothetical protein